jgi:hypothetical protein
LTAFVDDELSAQERESVLRLVRHSEEARSFLEELQKNAEHLRHLPRRTLDQEFSHQLVQRIASRNAPVSRYSILKVRSQVPAWFGLATAAAVLLMVGVGSYLYVATVARHDHEPSPGPLAAHPQLAGREAERLPQPTADAGAHDTLADAAPPKAEVKPLDANSGSVAKLETAPAERLPWPVSEDEDAVAISVPKTEVFKRVDWHLGLTFSIRDLEQEKRKQRLLEELRKGDAYRFDLGCLEALPAVERMQAAFKAHGIRLVVDPGTQTTLKLRFKGEVSYVLYTENVTPEEVLAVFQYLRSEDRKAETKRTGPAQFDALQVNAMTPSDHRELSKLLGVDPAQLDAVKPKAPPGVDIHKPLSAGTADEVAQALKGQGTPRPEPGKPIVNGPDRLAVLVPAYHSSRSRPSREVKLFLDGRKERASGTIQMLLVLRGTKG